MSDVVFRARFDGREWWAIEGVTTNVVGLWFDRVAVGDGLPMYRVPKRMVERIEDLPPELTEPGTVVYDRDDVAWMRGVAGLWHAVHPDKTWETEWPDLTRERGPLHPYPKAPRDEIEALQEHVLTLQDNISSVRDERDELQRRIEDALRYVDDPGNWSAYDTRRHIIAKKLRGDS